MKVNFLLIFIFIVSILFFGCANESNDNNSNGFKVEWEVVENTINDENRYKATFTIFNNSNRTLGKTGWALYYNQIMGDPNTKMLTEGTQIEHISGDFYRLVPTETFMPLTPRSKLTITYENINWAIKTSDAPRGMYWVFEEENGKEGAPIPVTDYTIKPFSTDKLKRTATDEFPVPTPEYVYQQNANLKKLKSDEIHQVIPTPISYTFKELKVSITKKSEIHYEKGLEKEANFLNKTIKKGLGTTLKISEGFDDKKEANHIYLGLSLNSIQGIAKEGYQLEVLPNEGDYIAITGTDAAGVFYGIQSLISAFDLDVFKETRQEIEVNGLIIKDGPRFPYRGFHLDVARNFQTKGAILKVLDLMAFYKLNKFHFHLTDDEGWRLAIDGLPELTAIGGKRGHTTDESDRLYPAYGSGADPTHIQGTGHYTRADFIEILQYANERHIEVIPEIDLPGHARAAIVAMKARYNNLKTTDKKAAEEFLLHDPTDASKYMSVQNYNDNVVCVCEESVYHFIEYVVEDLVKMYAEANVPLTTVHTGGDEVPKGVWSKSPACDALYVADESVHSVKDLSNYFLKRFDSILKKHNLVTAGWEEIATYHPKEGAGLEPNPAFVDSKFQPYVWNAVFGWGGEDLAYKLANAGYPVVICNASNLYFDFAYDKAPEETGLYWAGFTNTRSPYEFIPLDLFKSANMGRYGETLNPEELAKGKVKLTAEGRKNIIGIQAQLWSEAVIDAEKLEYQIAPKMMGFAERAWAKQPIWATEENSETRKAGLEKDWNVFVNTLGQRDLERLNYLFGGFNYRIPTPGAIVEFETVKANILYPGLSIKYTTDGSKPTISSFDYKEPITEKSTIRLRTFNSEGRGSRTITILNE